MNISLSDIVPIEKRPSPKDFGKRKRVKRNKLTDVLYNENGDTLTWSVRDGYPRITCTPKGFDYERYDNDKLIISKFTPAILTYIKNSILDQIKDGSTRDIIICKNVKFENNVRTDEIVDDSTITIFKENHTIILEITNNKLTFTFPITYDEKWFRIKSLSKEDKLLLEKLNMRFAKSYIETVTDLLLKSISRMSDIKLTAT